MIRKIPSPKADCVRVIFELPACIWADRIFLVGDFNEWNTAIAPFTQGRNGIWQAVVDDFHVRHPLAGLRVSINDMGATPAVVSLRLDQAMAELTEARP